MLKNELVKVADLIDQLRRSYGQQEGSASSPAADFEQELRELVVEVEARWSGTVLSHTSGERLRRYFKHHLDHLLAYCQILHQLVADNRDRIFLLEQAIGLQSFCCRLIGHLEQFYPEYFSWELPAPAVYHALRVAELWPRIAAVIAGLQRADISISLKNVLINYLREMGSTGGHYTFSFGALAYFDHFLQDLAGLCFDDAQEVSARLNEKLLKLNFNHLEFLLYLQDQLMVQLIDLSPGDQLQLLRRQRLIMSHTLSGTLIYDVRFPAIPVWMQGWLSEEIAYREQEVQKEPYSPAALPEKIALQLSVAQLACLIWLFFRENIYTENNLRQLFKFMARHYRTKRQARISWESLSKEYYSLGQFTAAEIRDLLRRMISRINDEFFPV